MALNCVMYLSRRKMTDAARLGSGLEARIFLGLAKGKREIEIGDEGSSCQFKELNKGRNRNMKPRFVRDEGRIEKKAACASAQDSMTESSILAQNERWRRVLSMQVERMATLGWPEVADG